VSLRGLAVTAIPGERISPDRSADADAHDWAGLISLLRGRGMELRAEGDGWYRVVDAEPVFRPMPSGWRDVSREVAQVIVEAPVRVSLDLSPVVAEALTSLMFRTGKTAEQVVASALRALSRAGATKT
jgi:hypothetical protein